MKKIYLICFLIYNTTLSAQTTLEFDGDLFLQTIHGFDSSKTFFVKSRYLPELAYRKTLDSLQSFTVVTAANFGNSAFLNPQNSLGIQTEFTPYRLWARYLNRQWEVRLGLQKIDFGSATLLRPLQWFNQIDPRDPLALTNGVNALLLRYYFKNNANLWLWGLYGNKKTRGFDALPTVRQKPEFGARFQTTVPKGELAFSYHHRTAGPDETRWIKLYPESREFRVGFDAKWDLGAGLWLESTYIKRQRNIGPFTQQFLLTLGTDYTFDLGNGLNIIGEHLVATSGERQPFTSPAQHITALNASYPINFFETLNLFFYHQWQSAQNTFLLNYQHQFSKIMAYVMAYYNPDRAQGIQQNELLNIFSGPGIQLLFVFNH